MTTSMCEVLKCFAHDQLDANHTGWGTYAHVATYQHTPVSLFRKPQGLSQPLLAGSKTDVGLSTHEQSHTLLQQMSAYTSQVTCHSDIVFFIVSKGS